MALLSQLVEYVILTDACA